MASKKMSIGILKIFKALFFVLASVLIIAVMRLTEAKGKTKGKANAVMRLTETKGKTKGKAKKLIWPYNGSKKIFHTPGAIFEKVKSASVNFNKIIGVEMVHVVRSKNLKCLEKNQINEICVKPSKKNHNKKVDGFSSWSYRTTPYGIKKFECDIFLFSDNLKPLVIEHEMGHCVGFNHAPKGLMTATINFAKPFIYKPQFRLWNAVVAK